MGESIIGGNSVIQIGIIVSDIEKTVQKYTTKPSEQAKFESHMQYVDVQYLINVTEQMAIAPTENLSELASYNKEKDVLYFADTSECSVLRLCAGDCVALFPVDAHKYSYHGENDQASYNFKIVGKVKIN